MPDHDFWGTLDASSDRYRDWLHVFGADALTYREGGGVRVPITTPIPEQVRLPIGVQTVYFVKLALLDEAQLERLKSHLCERFEVSRAELEAEFARTPGREVPILGRDLSVTVYNPQRWT